MNEITEGLFALQDLSYRDFHAKLIPNVRKDTIIGVRTPQLRKYARIAAKQPNVEEFLTSLPHDYYDENNLHGALLGLLCRTPEEYLARLEDFLPYINNWATCDMMSPKVFKKDLALVYTHILRWLESDHTYTKRFGIVTLLGYYLDDAFAPEHLALVAGTDSGDYYVKMAVAWYFSIALVKQYDTAIGYFEKPTLDPWTHNKAIQKVRESLRITPERKEYLKSLKR